MELERIGWRSFFADQVEGLRERWPKALVGRVARTESGSVTLWTTGGIVDTKLPSRLKAPASRPAVGDWVVFQKGTTDARVLEILDRTTAFVRRAAGRKLEKQIIAANVDVVFIVSGLDGDFNPRRVERYLTAVADGGAQAVVLLTKAGLCPDWGTAVEEAKSAAPGVDVHALDVVAGFNADVGDRYLTPGVAVTLVGSSGVGKSTLLNHWAQEERQPTAAVRGRDNRGQHTTTRRELFEIPGGALVIDTPGMRELALWADQTAVHDAFPDIQELAGRCRFADCRHAQEPDCAVVAAAGSGALDPKRLESFRSLHHEASLAAAEMPDHERRARQKQFAGVVRSAKRKKGR